MPTTSEIIDQARENLKIDPTKKIWTDVQLTRWMNEGFAMLPVKSDWQDVERMGQINLKGGQRLYDAPSGFHRLITKGAKVYSPDGSISRLTYKDLSELKEMYSDLTKTADIPLYVYQTDSKIGVYPVPNNVVLDNLEMYLDLNENTGTTVSDSSVNGNNGALTGTTAFSDGKVAGGIEFDGIGDGLITVTDSTTIQNIFAGGATISAWVRPQPNPKDTSWPIMIKGPNTFWLFYLYQQSNDSLRVIFDMNAFSVLGGIWHTTDREVRLSEWTHIAVTYDNSSLTNDPIIYVNGTAVDITEISTPSGVVNTDAGEDLYVGRNDSSDVTFSGCIDDVRIYSDILTADEVDDISNNGNILELCYYQWPATYTATDTPDFPPEWHFLLEHYIEYRAWGILPGREQSAQLALAKWESGILAMKQERLRRTGPTLSYRSLVKNKKRIS